MAYESVDKLQNILASEVFGYTTDKKKAAGRALGTFVEIITYYLIKAWNLEKNTSIEYPLSEYANSEITHNVEFTLHGSRTILSNNYSIEEIPISATKIVKQVLKKDTIKAKSGFLIDKNYTIKNALSLFEEEGFFVNAYVNSNAGSYEICQLKTKPFAMFECKRVGVEEGMRKGPQTIEKAKQGSYVARTVSALQRIRCSDGSMGGIIQKQDGSFIIKDYYSLLNELINTSNLSLLKDFILTVGVISNHGNWFTSENQNKELKVLAQSYDWLIFLTDKGIGEFITDLLLKPTKENSIIKKAFDKSYGENKIANVFTKVKMDYYADKVLTNYFILNQNKIEKWFNIITPKKLKLGNLKEELQILANKNWWEK